MPGGPRFSPGLDTRTLASGLSLRVVVSRSLPWFRIEAELPLRTWDPGDRRLGSRSGSIRIVKLARSALPLLWRRSREPDPDRGTCAKRRCLEGRGRPGNCGHPSIRRVAPPGVGGPSWPDGCVGQRVEGHSDTSSGGTACAATASASPVPEPGPDVARRRPPRTALGAGSTRGSSPGLSINRQATLSRRASNFSNRLSIRSRKARCSVSRLAASRSIRSTRSRVSASLLAVSRLSCSVSSRDFASRASALRSIRSMSSRVSASRFAVSRLSCSVSSRDFASRAAASRSIRLTSSRVFASRFAVSRLSCSVSSRDLASRAAASARISSLCTWAWRSPRSRRISNFRWLATCRRAEMLTINPAMAILTVATANTTCIHIGISLILDHSWTVPPSCRRRRRLPPRCTAVWHP